MTAGSVWDRYARYLAAAPDVVVEWHDRPTDAHGWLVLNSLRGGAAGGGTRMHAAVTREEVVYLAKAMELKFAYSGPGIGGGKSGIAFDPADPRRLDVLRRWFAAVRPYLMTCYGTAGDVNVDEQRDVLPLCRELGLASPQQGIVMGHLGRSAAEVTSVLEGLEAGLALPLAGSPYAVEGTDLTVSDMVTGFGVACGAEGLLTASGAGLPGARVIVEGFGNVGAAAALYLARLGARIVGLIDVRSAVVAPEGLGAEQMDDLLRRRQARCLPEHALLRSGPDRFAAYDVDADLMVPAALSGSVGGERMERLSRAGVRWIVSGANQPFHEEYLGDTRTQRRADRDFTVLADVVGSMGMARAFSHLMAGGDRLRPEDVFEAVASSVREAVSQVVERAGGAGPGTLAAAIDLALERVETTPAGVGTPRRATHDAGGAGGID